ncbi:MAG: tol-pal system protein YbgF [Methylovirgula sp.]|uniref:tol-pal system protein YbgF n=1 Tax=Methylovirgula sp. TaxID=1978224 RepID=UPI003075FD44
MTRLNAYVTALTLAGFMILSATSLSFAQNYGAPPDNVGGGGDSQGNGGSYTPDASGGSPDASLIVRVERLEDQIRQMTGQIQQMQFENHQLQDQLKKFEQDVDFRLQDSRGGHLQRHSEMTPASPPAAVTDADSGSASSNATADPADSADAGASADTPARHGRGDDVFDPAADPNAPGAPKPLGAGESAPPPPTADNAGGAANSDPNAPLNLQSAYTPPAPSVPAGGVSTPADTHLASTQPEPASPRQEFDAALGYFKQKDYDNAERGFQSFLDKNPKTRLTAEAMYFLGESYSARGRAREAAEQFLKISTNYADSARAPQAMLRLGESLHTLGAKEQACATFSEVPHKYPNASAAVKAAAEREAKRSQCGA